MRKISVVIIVCGVAILSLGFSIFIYISQPKVAYVHVQEVYNDFEFKKELENKFERIKTSRKRILDSLEIQLNALAQNIQNSEVNRDVNMQNYQYLMADFQNKQKTFAQDNQAVSDKYTEEIWVQLNQYVKEFGEIKGYDFIHGADGSGSVMHANDQYNQTEQLKEFVNERYQGGLLNVK